MLSTLKIKLLPNSEQHSALLETMKRFNLACNYISEIAFEQKTFGKFKVHKLCYYDVRDKFGLSSQMTVRAVGKVTESYKTENKTLHAFRETGAMVYDDRILSFDNLELVSILVLGGRIKVPMILGKYHRGIVEGNRIRGQADLVLIDNIFYIMLCVERPTDSLYDTDDFVGVDLGIVNLATTSDGEVMSGSAVRDYRRKSQKLRSSLQAKGTKSAKRKLKKSSKKERRFATDINHCISKKIVSIAKDTHRGIAMEDLSCIRKCEKTVRKAQRKELSSWSFYQLRQFVTYKAEINGVPLVFVDPRYTSQTCPKCGNVDKANRKTQSEFRCTACDYAVNADINAAVNIRSRAIVNLPIVTNL